MMNNQNSQTKALEEVYEALEEQKIEKNNDDERHMDTHTHPLDSINDIQNQAEIEEASPLDAQKLTTLFDPYIQGLNAEGMDAYQACEMLLSAHRSLEENPEETVKWLAEQYGVNLSSSDNINKQLPEFMEAQLQHHSVEKNKEGHLKYPYLSNLQSEVRNTLNEGRAKNVVDAYEMACWSQPEFREERLKEMHCKLEREIQSAIAEKRKNAEKAAALNLDHKGMIVNESRLSKGSKRDTMAEIYDQYIGS